MFKSESPIDNTAIYISVVCQLFKKCLKSNIEKVDLGPKILMFRLLDSWSSQFLDLWGILGFFRMSFATWLRKNFLNAWAVRWSRCSKTCPSFTPRAASSVSWRDAPSPARSSLCVTSDAGFARASWEVTLRTRRSKFTSSTSASTRTASDSTMFDSFLTSFFGFHFK